MLQQQKEIIPTNSIFNSQTIQQIENILTYAKTFKRHPILIMNQRQISPYDLACNGFVNKNFKEEEKQQPLDYQSKNLSCICRIAQCSKSLKLSNQSNGILNDENDMKVQLTDHQQNCTFYKIPFKKLNISLLFQQGKLIFDIITQSYTKDIDKNIEKLNIDWNELEGIFLPEKSIQKLNPSNFILDFYISIDAKFNMTNKKITKSTLFSLFGWKYCYLKQLRMCSLKCYFCGKRYEAEIKKIFDFTHNHNSWCLILNKQYQMWKIMLKKVYLKLNQQNQRKYQIQKIKNRIYQIPKTQASIQSNQIKYQIYELVKPSLQKIDSLLEGSFQFLGKQRKNNLQDFKKINKQKNEDQNEEDQIKKDIQKHQNLNQISRNCQQIIRKFINSINIGSN